MSARGAIVVGDLHDGVLGNTLDATLVFHPELTPMGVGNATYLDVTKKTNVVGGAWSMALVGGIYTVECIPFGRKIAIVVPINDTNTYQFNTVSDIILMMGNAGTINVSNLTTVTLYATNIYSYSITNTAVVTTSNLFANTALIDILYVTSNLYFFERTWPGPTNSLDMRNARWFYEANVPCSVTGFTHVVTGVADNATLLTISNASSTNLTFTLPTGVRIPTGDVNLLPYTVTNGDLLILSFQVVNNRTNVVPRTFH